MARRVFERLRINLLTRVNGHPEKTRQLHICQLPVGGGWERPLIV